MTSEQISPHERSPVRRLLAGLVTQVCRYPLPVLVLSVLLAGLSIYAAATRLQYKTQRNDLMSPHKDYQQRWRAYLAEFGDDDDIVVVVKGDDRPRMEQALETLAAKVQARPELFDRLFYKVDLRGLRNRALMFLSTKEIESIQQHLGDMGLLLKVGPIGWNMLTLSSLLREAEQRAEKMKPGERLRPGDEEFLTQLWNISRNARDVVADPSKYKTPWGSLLARPPEQKDLLAEPQYFFSDPPGDKSGGQTLAFLLVRPIKDTASFTYARKSVSAIRHIVADTRADFPGVEFGVTGLPVLETDEMTAADHDTRLASWLAIAGVMMLFFLVYRGIWYPLLTVATLLIGTAWAMGWLTLTVGHLNILSATFAVMLIGMGDYGVLWVMRYEQARQRGADVRTALLHTTTHVAVSNLTAATTLALAFFAAMFADFQAVAELGWIAGCGVLLCAFACFTILPALLMLFDRRKPMQNAECGMQKEKPILSFPSALCIPHSALGGDAWLPGLARRAGWVAVAGLLLTVGLGYCAWRGVRYDHNLLHLQARDLDSVKWELTLIEHTAGANWHAVSYTATPEEALRLKARYEALPEVARVVEVASLVPADQGTKVRLLADIRQRLAHLPERGKVIPHARPDSQDLRARLVSLAERLQPLAGSARGANGEPSTLLADLRDSVCNLHLQLMVSPPAAVEERVQEFEQRLAGDLAEDLHRLREVATPAPIALADLPPDLRVRYVGQSGKWLLRVFARESLWEFPQLEQFTRQIQAIDPAATGKPFGTVEGLKAMKNGLQRAGIYAFLVIVAVLWIDFRSWKRTAVAVAPLVLAVVLSLGILGLLGVPLNPANMIAFPLILGVGVDNGVHVLHDYLLRRREHGSTISYAIGRGVLVKALTTMIGFGTLMLASERGLAGLGLILTLGVGCSMLTALVLLPAVLHLRAHRQPPSAAPEARMAEARLAA
jgi:hopanoid biosynthesis associated RND transporter like protein HpnN